MAEKRTYANRREELIRAVAKRRRKIKFLAIEYKGSKCQICRYDTYQGALDLHHLNPKDKEFALSHKGYTRSWQKVKAELDKCVLLCANCHREVEAGIAQLPGVIQVEKRGEFGETRASSVCRGCGITHILQMKKRAIPSQAQKQQTVEGKA